MLVTSNLKCAPRGLLTGVITPPCRAKWGRVTGGEWTTRRAHPIREFGRPGAAVVAPLPGEGLPAPPLADSLLYSVICVSNV